jgi:hypothetical protein
MGDVDTSSNGVNFTLSAVSASASTVTLRVVAATLDAYNSVLMASFDWDGISYTNGDDIVVSAA